MGQFRGMLTGKLFACVGALILCVFPLLSSAEVQTENFYLYGQKFTVLRPSGGSEHPLLILFHGCKMDAAGIVDLTGIEKWIPKKKFMVLVPEQSRILNSDACWNWFLGINQQTVFWSELAIQREALRWVSARYPVDPRRVYVMGFSSGAAMAANMFYCYPDAVIGASLHSGMAFRSAGDLFEAEDALVSGSTRSPEKLAADALACGGARVAKRFPRQMIIFHGTADPRVAVRNGEQTAEQFLNFWDLADDQKWNQSVIFRKVSYQTGSGFFPATVTRYRSTEAELSVVTISNLQHRWSGGAAGNIYAEPASLDATAFSVNHFFHILKGR